MRTAIEGKSSLGHRVAHPSTESINGERLAPFSGQDTDMLSRKRRKSCAQRKCFFNDDRNACLAPRVLKIVSVGLNATQTLDRHSRPRSWQSVMISKFRGRRCGAGCGRRGSGCLALNEQQDRQPRFNRVPDGPRRSSQKPGMLKTRALQIAEAAKLKSKALRVSRRRSDMVVSAAPAHAPSEAAK